MASQRGAATTGRKRALDALELVTPPPNARAVPGAIGKISIAQLVDDELDQAARDFFDESVIALVRRSHTAARAVTSVPASTPATATVTAGGAGGGGGVVERTSIASTLIARDAGRSDAPLFGDALALFAPDDLFVKTPRGSAIAAAAAAVAAAAAAADMSSSSAATTVAAPSLISPESAPAAVSTLQSTPVPLKLLLARAQYFRKRHVDALIEYIGNYRARVERQAADDPPLPPPPPPPSRSDPPPATPKKARLASHVAKAQRTQMADADALENLAFQPPPPMLVDTSAISATPWSTASTSTATADYVPKKLRF